MEGRQQSVGGGGVGISSVCPHQGSSEIGSREPLRSEAHAAGLDPSLSPVPSCPPNGRSGGRGTTGPGRLGRPGARASRHGQPAASYPSTSAVEWVCRPTKACEGESVDQGSELARIGDLETGRSGRCGPGPLQPLVSPLGSFIQSVQCQGCGSLWGYAVRQPRVSS